MKIRSLAYAAIVLLTTGLNANGQQVHDRINVTRIANRATVTMTGATPSVAFGNVFRTANGGSTTITNFAGGVDSQQITIICGETNTVIANNANILTSSGSSIACVLEQSQSFVFDAAAGKWTQNSGGSSSGGGANPAGNNGDAQLRNGATLVAGDINDSAGIVNVGGTQTNINADFATLITPYTDVRLKGVRAINPNAAPAIAGITATTNGTTSVAISSASSFQNGDGVTIWAAGTACGLSTPGTPTVTPSVSSGPTGTLQDVAGPAGSTAYQYQVVARDKKGCLTAAGTAGTTLTGQAALGSQTVTLNTCTRALDVVTCNTNSPHTLAVGSNIYQNSVTSAGNLGNTFGGWFIVTAVPDSTHYSYTSGLDTRAGAPAASTGGNLFWFNSNHLSWTAVPNAWEYYIYGRTSGSNVLLGVTQPSVTGDTITTFDDYGATMMAGFTLPGYVPSTPPGASQPGPFTTTIASGAGSTTLVLAAAPTTNVSGATILFDDGPNLVTAATSGNNLFFPAGTGSNSSYIISSFTILPSLRISQVGQIVLNETLQIQAGQWFGDTFAQSYSIPSFALQGGASVVVRAANPGVFSNTNAGFTAKALNVTSFGTNAALLWFAEQTINSTFENVNFTSSSSGTDFMGMGLLWRGIPSNSSFINSMRRVLFIGGPAFAFGTTSTPLFFCNNCGQTEIKDLMLSRRSMAYLAPQAGGDLSIDGGRYQGGVTPFLMLIGAPGTNAVISNYELDTTSHALVANFTTNGSNLTVNGGSLNTPDSTIVTGKKFSVLQGIGGIAAGQVRSANGTQASGQVGASAQATFGHPTFGFGTDSEQNVAWNLNLPFGHGVTLPPQAPTPTASVTTSCSGFPTAGSYQYAVAVTGINGGMSTIGAQSNAVTLNGTTQCASLTWTDVPGAHGFIVYKGASGGTNPQQIFNGNCFAAGTDIRANGCTDTGTGAGGNGPGVNTMGIPAIYPGSIATKSLVFGSTTPAGTNYGTATVGGTFAGDRTVTIPDNTGTVAETNLAQTFSAAQVLNSFSGTCTTCIVTSLTQGSETQTALTHPEFTAFLSGALTATFTGKTWTLDKAITVTRVQLQSRVAPSGCSANAVVRLTDGSTNQDVTLTAAANDSGAITKSYAAGATLTVGVQTAAAGCTTSPGDTDVTVQYRTQ